MASRQPRQLVEVVHRLTQDARRLVNIRVLVHFQGIQLRIRTAASGRRTEQCSVGNAPDVGAQRADPAQQFARCALALQGALGRANAELLHLVAQVEQVVQGIGTDADGLLGTQRLGTGIGNLAIFLALARCQRLQLRRATRRRAVVTGGGGRRVLLQRKLTGHIVPRLLDMLIAAHRCVQPGIDDAEIVRFAACLAGQPVEQGFEIVNEGAVALQANALGNALQGMQHP